MGPTQFDVSSSILLRNYLAEKEILSTFHTPNKAVNRWLGNTARLVLDRFVDVLVTWDTVHFADLFSNGIRYEHQFVFCPLWWRLIRSIPVNPETPFYSRLIWATVIANMCHFAAALVLYFYTLAVFRDARIFSSERMALATLMLYVCSPGAAFLTAPYSEPIAALCSFLCLFARDAGMGEGRLVYARVLQPTLANARREGKKAKAQNTDKRRSCSGAETLQKHQSWLAQRETAQICAYLGSGALAALAFGFRANCLFLGLVYVYDLAFKKTKSRFLPLAAGLCLGAAFLAAQIHSYMVVCSSDRGAWCGYRVPTLFTYAQSHYWGNGLFRYWTAGNVPNFLFAAPVVALLVYATRYFAQIYPVERTLPILAVNGVFVCLLALFWHVQIVTRIHTFLPVVYWLVAGLLTQHTTVGQKQARLCVAYFVVWNVLQTALFSAFLPPA